MLRDTAHLSVSAFSESFKDFVSPYKGLDRVAGASPEEKASQEYLYDFVFCFLFGMTSTCFLLLLAMGMGGWSAISRPGAWECVLPAFFELFGFQG